MPLCRASILSMNTVQFMSYLTTRKSLIGHSGWALLHYKWAIPVAVFEAPPVPAVVRTHDLSFRWPWTYHKTTGESVNYDKIRVYVPTLWTALHKTVWQLEFTLMIQWRLQTHSILTLRRRKGPEWPRLDLYRASGEIRRQAAWWSLLIQRCWASDDFVFHLMPWFDLF